MARPRTRGSPGGRAAQRMEVRPPSGVPVGDQGGVGLRRPDEGLDRDAFRRATSGVFDLFKDKWEPGFYENIQSKKL